MVKQPCHFEKGSRLLGRVALLRSKVVKVGVGGWLVMLSQQVEDLSGRSVAYPRQQGTLLGRLQEHRDERFPVARDGTVRAP